MSTTTLHVDRIPPIGTVPQAERMFKVNWVATELRSPSGAPMHAPDYVARLGRAAHLIDVRTPEELVGPLGYIPGSEWVPEETALTALDVLDRDAPIVIVSRGGERSNALAKALEQRGKRFVCSLMGGVVAWRQVGFATVRDPSILERKGVLREVQASWEPVARPVTRDEIERHVGDPLSLRWMKLAALLVSGRLSCVDGRDDSGVIGTPGGDAGEFLLAATALEEVSGQQLNDAAVRTLMLRWIDAFGRFYLHSDVQAANKIIAALRADRRLDAALTGVYEALEWRRFWRSPPEDVRGALLEHSVNPAHIGCGHIRLSLTRPADYCVRRELVESFYRAFWTLRWDGADENELTVLPGGHAEGAVTRIFLADGVDVFSRVPLVSPMVEGAQMFLAHPQVTAYLRGLAVRFLARQGDLAKLPPGGEAELQRVITSIADTQLTRTLSTLARGLPIFDVTFHDGGVTVVEAGRVPNGSSSP